MSLKRNKVEIFFIFALLTISIFLPPFNARVLASQEGEIIWVQTSNPSVGSEWPNAVAVDGSGLYVVGGDDSPHNTQWRIEKRSLTDGTIIWFQTSNPSPDYEYPSAVAVDGSGLYVVGQDGSSGDYQWRIEKRSLTDGAIIWVQTSNPSADPSFLSDRALDVAVDVSGLYVVGYDTSPGAPQWRIEKRAPSDGVLIWSKTNNPGNGDAVAYGITVDDSGLYIAGYDSSPGDLQWRIEKRIKITSVGGIGTLVNITHGDEWFQHRILLYMTLAVVSLLFFMPFARRLVK